MLSKKELFTLLKTRFENDECKRLCDLPLPSTLLNATKSAKRIKQAMDSGELIGIVGDYDVDGIVSTLIVDEFLNHAGIKAITRIPNRFKDGYGLNENIVKELAALGVKLILTVDNGILAYDAAKTAKDLGICLIISDHHSLGEVLPDAYAVVNPKQKDCGFKSVEICGAQVAWYLLAALKSELKSSFDLSCFLELLCIAIIADMMELKDLNRLLVQKGLKLLNASKRPCFRALKAHYEKDNFTYEDLGFIIAPLINCAGRMSDASKAYEFLKANTPQIASQKLEELLKLNDKRKEIESNICKKAIKQVKEEDLALVVADESWHEGVLGIVASRLCKLYDKPSFVMSIKNKEAKGSARSVANVDILGLLKENEALLLGYGGHKGAAGLSMKAENVPAFKKAIQEKLLLNPPLNLADKSVLGELDAKEIDWELIEILEHFEPFGQKNPRPFFLFKDYLINDILLMGKDKSHVKLSICKNGHSFFAIFFNSDKNFIKNSKCTFIASVCKNVFKGRSNIQLLVREVLE